MKRRILAGLTLLLLLLAAAVCASAAEAKTITYYVEGEQRYYPGYSTYTPGKDAFFNLPIIEKTGYHFDGWYREEDLSGDGIMRFQQKEETDDLQFYATFVKCSGVHTITFCDENGDPMKDKDGNVLPEYTYCQEERPVLPDVNDLPKQEGKGFVNWFDSQTGGNRVTDSYLRKCTSDLQIYARYAALKTISFVYGDKILSSAKYTPGRDRELNLPTPIYSYKYFLAWHLEQDLSDEGFVTLNPSEYEEDLTLYLEADENTYLVFYKYYNKDTKEFEFVKNDKNYYVINMFNASHPNVQLHVMENTETEGFSGWYLNEKYTGEFYYSQYQYKDGDELKTVKYNKENRKARILYAHYMPIRTVTYMDGDTVLDITGEQYTKYWYRQGATRPLPAMEAKDNTFFVGWHRNADFSDRAQKVSFSCEQDEDLTFYAEFRTLPSTWTLNLGSSAKGNKARLTIPKQTGTVTWASSDRTVVTVSGNASSVLITAKKAGTATVTLKVGGTAVARCEVTVRALDGIVQTPKSLTQIKASAFENSAAEAVVLGDAVLKIGSRAFAGCVSLVYIYIPDTVKSIADDAFDGINPIIYCSAGSAAAAYADNNGFNWADIR